MVFGADGTAVLGGRALLPFVSVSLALAALVSEASGEVRVGLVDFLED